MNINELADWLIAQGWTPIGDIMTEYDDTNQVKFWDTYIHSRDVGDDVPHNKKRRIYTGYSKDECPAIGVGKVFDAVLYPTGRDTGPSHRLVIRHQRGGDYACQEFALFTRDDGKVNGSTGEAWINVYVNERGPAVTVKFVPKEDAERRPAAPPAHDTAPAEAEDRPGSPL